MKKDAINLIIYGIVACVIIWAISASAPSPNMGTISVKITQLCEDHPDKDCNTIWQYCKESLERGFDCLID